LVLPPAAAPPALLVSTSPNSPTDALLPTLGTARHVADISMVGGAPFHVYDVSGAVPGLPGETAVTSAEYHASASDALRLDAATIVAPGILRLRWTVLAAASVQSAPEQYHIQAATNDGGSNTTLGSVDCQPTRWQAGETVFTWLSLSPGGATRATPQSVAITVSASAPELYTPTAGPLHLLSGRFVGNTPTVVLPNLGPGEQSRPGTVTESSYILSLATLSG
jgi:hypothetical protein